MSHVADMPAPDPASDRLSELQTELLHTGRELHRLNREVEAPRDQLATERVEREELLAVVSHELRTPITVIGGYLRLLLSEEAGGLTEEQQRFLEESRRSVGRLDAFVERVLDGSRHGHEGEVLEVSSAPLGPVIEEVAASFHGLLGERGASLAVDVEPGLEARFDRGAVERVLMNLVGNAIRYAGDAGAIQISTGASHSESRAFVEVAVSDDGKAIATATGARILHLREGAAFVAKCRSEFAIPDKIEIPRENPWAPVSTALKGN